mgnify:CR=1 FL=1
MSSPVTVRPTGFGLVLAVLLAGTLAVADSAADPRIAGMAWAALAATLLLGVVWPLWATLGAGVRVLRAPTDAYVGDVVASNVQVRAWPGPLELRIRVPGDPDDGPWQGIEVPEPVTIAIGCTTRRVVDVLQAEVRCSSPLGALKVVRRWQVALPAPLHVAPRPTPVSWRPDAEDLRAVDRTASRATSAGDVVRSVRPYVPGDAAHLVHWPTSARAGELLVRELEPPSDLLVAVVLELSGGARDEELASWASGVVRSVLRLGGTAVLCSHDIDGPRRTDVVTPRRLDRALAAATPGPPAVAPMGAHLVQVGP